MVWSNPRTIEWLHNYSVAAPPMRTRIQSWKGRATAAEPAPWHLTRGDAYDGQIPMELGWRR